MRWWTWAFGIWLVAAPAFAADEGRALVARGAAAHGGVARFRALGVVAARIDDDWTWIGRAWSDWPIDPAQGVVRADFGLHKALLVFDRPAGLRWGFDSVGGWSAVDGARVLDSKTDGRASFMLRTIGYYWTLPFRFLEAGARYRALGIREDFGESWDVVEVAFDDRPGHPGDVFTAYYNLATGCLHHAYDTSRERSRFARGLIRYDGYTRAEGIVWPSDLHVALTAPLPLALHHLRFTDIHRDPAFDPGGFEKPAAPVTKEN